MAIPVVKITNLTVQYAQNTVLKELNWTIFSGENWRLGGKSGSGKTVLAQAIAGKESYSGDIQNTFDFTSPLSQQVLFVPCWYSFTNLDGDRNFYYQQRYNRHQTPDTLTVYAELLHYGNQEGLNVKALDSLLASFEFTACTSNQLIELSSGEHKKLQLIKALWLQPQLLIIDQPYTGLDHASREKLNEALDELSEKGGQYLLICNDQELPRSINRFAEINQGQLQVIDPAIDSHKEVPRTRKSLPDFLKKAPEFSTGTLIKMVNIQVNYGEKQVLKRINWEVKAGEKWVLQGPNGSGKSTLLSLINGDHPQAYSNDLHLFGKKRGSGESIWEIKEKLGIISPELHWYFDLNAPVWQSIASGFFDSMGLFQELRYEKQVQVEEVLAFFELTRHKNHPLKTLPLGKQRLVLLARTIIKNPSLLILDEPCQGLDEVQTRYFNDVVDELVAHGKTLIYVGHIESQIPTCIDNKLKIENGSITAVENLTERILR